MSRCQLIPLPDHQVSFQVDGHERSRWHFGPSYTRPFFYPLVGPAGATLTRMGHPGAPSHDHHRSIWFAHSKVLGIDFWSENTAARIRQRRWLYYGDGDDQAVMAVELGWFDGHDPKPLIDQQLVAALRPVGEETLLELQATLRPVAESLELGQTNFGLLAVRMAKSISVHFGDGQITSSTGAVGEAAIFGQAAKWMDYCGPIPSGATEGICYHDHPDNPGHPAHWHVREDGWMGASLCLANPITLKRDAPLTVRYLLHAHAGGSDAKRNDRIRSEFAGTKPWAISKATVKHQEFDVRRVS